MVASVLGVVAVAVLLMLGLGVMAPIAALPILAIVAIPLGIMLAGRLFQHAGGSVATSTGATPPSTREASYDPVADPSERR